MNEPVLDPTALERIERLGGRELVERMVRLFLENAAARITAAIDAARQGDDEAVERAAHSLRSSAANVGAIELQRRADVLEAALVAGNEIDLLAAAAGLEEAFEAIRPVLTQGKGAAG